jgi:hypothetical protein
LCIASQQEQNGAFDRSVYEVNPILSITRLKGHCWHAADRLMSNESGDRGYKLSEMKLVAAELLSVVREV